MQNLLCTVIRTVEFLQDVHLIQTKVFGNCTVDSNRKIDTDRTCS